MHLDLEESRAIWIRRLWEWTWLFGPELQGAGTVHAQKVAEDGKRDDAKGNGPCTIVPLMSQSAAHLPRMLIEDGETLVLLLSWNCTGGQEERLVVEHFATVLKVYNQTQGQQSEGPALGR